MDDFFKQPLEERDVELARRIADIRNSKNGEVPNYRVTRKQSDWEINFMGALGEIACGIYFQYPPDMHFDLHGDNRAPDLFAKHLGAEIKTTKTKPATLILNELDHFETDIAVVCRTPDTFPDHVDHMEIWGFCTRKFFRENHFKRDYGYGERFCLSDLTPIDSIELLF